MIYRRLRPLCPRLHIKGFLIAGYPQFTRNYTPQNGIISSFSALSSISVLPVHFLRLPWKWRNSFSLRSPESEGIKFASCKALERHVPGVLGAKATQQDANFMPFDRLPCKLRVINKLIKMVLIYPAEKSRSCFWPERFIRMLLY